MEQLDRSESSIRSHAASLGLRQDRNSPFFKDWQQRAAASKVGRKRPDQALVMRRLHAEGKMKYTPAMRKARGLLSAAYIRTHGHPRGMLGKTQTPRARAAVGKRAREMWADPNSTFNSAAHRQRMSDTSSRNMALRIQTKGTIYSRSNNGWYRIGDHTLYFRSGWEVVYARYLQWLLVKGYIYSWQYEPKTFWFDKIKRGVRSYTPDFLVTDVNGEAFHEVKGWMDSKSVTKIKRMGLYHPTVKLLVIDKHAYKPIAELERLYPEAIKVTKAPRIEIDVLPLDL